MKGSRSVAWLVSALALGAGCSSEDDQVGIGDQAASARPQYTTSGTCGGLPRLDLGPDATPAGVCVGLVADASSAPKMKMPRGIVELPTGELIVTAMGSWEPNTGSVWMLTPKRAADGSTSYAPKQLLSRIDRPNGVALGPDPLDPNGKRVYVGTPSTIFRFVPNKLDPATGAPRVRDVITDLPGDSDKGGHPLKQLVFDGNDVYVNVGSSSDLCKTNDAYPKPCPDEAKDRAGIRRYVLEGPELLPKRFSNPNGTGTLGYEMVARGLRNSMALAIHPTSKVLLQGENGRDALGPELPHEELNVIVKGKHYGWPYCYDENLPSPEYEPFDCSKFDRAAQLLPAHAAPLGMKYYTGALFPETYRDQLVVAYHGYDPKGHRLVLVDVDAEGVPMGKPPREIIRNWDKTPKHPMGAPVDVFVAKDGSILLTEDKNQTVLRVFYDAAAGDGEPLAAQGSTSGGSASDEQAMCAAVSKGISDGLPFATIEHRLFDTQCVACHTGLLDKCDMHGNVDRLVKKGLVVPGDSEGSELYQRIAGKGTKQRMPLGGESVDDELVAAVKKWIDDGAKAP